MAPEMLGGGAYDLKVDIWALGVLTYKLFFGTLPFDSEYKSDMIE
jgi:serine/threonine protein kinase